MLEKKVEVDKIEILADGQIQVRTATIITEDGVEISRALSRKVITPDDDVSGEDTKIKDIAGVVHTNDVKNKFRKKMKDIEDMNA